MMRSKFEQLTTRLAASRGAARHIWLANTCCAKLREVSPASVGDLKCIGQRTPNPDGGETAPTRIAPSTACGGNRLNRARRGAYRFIDRYFSVRSEALLTRGDRRRPHCLSHARRPGIEPGSAVAPNRRSEDCCYGRDFKLAGTPVGNASESPPNGRAEDCVDLPPR